MEATVQGIRAHRRIRHGVVHTTKMCTRCLQEKPLDQFGRQTSGAIRPYCSPCRVERTRYDRERAATDPSARADMKRKARDYYGISLNEYLDAVEKFSNKQDGKCPICGRDDPRSLDHDHKSKRLRGLLCRDCNIALGLLQDSATFARNAAKYLTKTKTLDIARNT